MANRVVTRRTVLIAFAVLTALFLLIQLVPYRVENHPVAQEPAWDSAQTRALAKVACFDCHSNESHPLAVERIAPLSWWITNHVDEGRAALNFSDCVKRPAENEAPEAVREGSMPPRSYTWLGLHSKAKLSQSERDRLASGLDKTLAGWSCGSGEG